jgi:tubulin monoglycylase TTLL3/8
MSESQELLEDQQLLPAEQSEDRAITTSPPAQRFKYRCSSIEASEGRRVDFHKRHVDHLRELSAQKVAKIKQLEEEGRKLQLARERLARKVLRRTAHQIEPVVHQSTVKEEDSDEVTEGEENEGKRNVRKEFRSRYNSLLKSLAESNRLKQQREEQERQRRMMTAKRLKEDLGFDNVNSKLYDPTVSSLMSSGVAEEDILEKKGHRVQVVASPKTKARRREEVKGESKVEDKVRSKKATEDIVRRAQDHLALLAEKKAAELRKEEEERDRKAKIRALARESVKMMKSTAVPEPMLLTQELPQIQESPAKKKLDERALERLAKAQRRDVPVITDMALFRKKYKLTDKDKIYIIIGGYHDIRKALISRSKLHTDWFENPDSESPCFDLKWTLKAKSIDFRNMQEHQICNHFEKSSMITTKVGLSRSLRNLIWFKAVDIDSFFPRCYDVNTPEELEEFITEFQVVKAESVLKQAARGMKIPVEVLTVALSITLRRLRDLDDLIDSHDLRDWSLIREFEWEFLSAEWTPELIEAASSQPWFQKIQQSLPPAEVETRIPEVLEGLKTKYPQFTINGDMNSWIVKPAGLSRGRGISCHCNLDSILRCFEKEGLWVAQKYIETPLTLLRKKFDIRQWVLVTDWNPLTVWFYERCYLRFGVEDFSLDNFSNKFVHLTNNSIVKNSDMFDNAEIEGCMWHSEEFAEHLREQHGRDVWEEDIKPKIKEIVTYSLECVQDMIEDRKNSAELYGYDIMLSDDLTPWLIEVNASPAMDYSTDVTAELVKEVMEDAIKVMVDYHFARKKSRVDTGHFSLLHKAKRAVERPTNSFGLGLVCEGKAIRK